LAQGTKVSISTGVRAAGVTIRTRPTYLTADQQNMVHAYNKGTFRHPLFGDWKTPITQTGRPYFGSVILPFTPAMRVAMNEAVRDAGRTIRAGTVI
jgi:hypothetical protein